MAATIKGTANSALATSVTIPAHDAGDVIVIFGYANGINSSPTAPTASGTVPAWVSIQGGGGNSNGGGAWYFVATGTNSHTSGTWGSCSGLTAVVIQGAKTASPIGGFALSTANVVNSVVAPAITQFVTDGSSTLLYFYGHRNASAWGAAPAGFTRAGTEAANGVSGICLNVKTDSTSDGAAAQTNTANGGSFGQTIEIIADSAPSPVPTLVSSSVPTVTANAITMPSHSAGDLIVMYVHASPISTLPTVPAANAGTGVPTWNVLRSTAGTNYSNARLVWAWGTGSTTSGTWTNADMFEVAVLRGVNPSVPIGGNAISAVGAGVSSTAPAITLANNNGSSQLLHFHGFGDAVNAVGTIGAAAIGYTQRAAVKPSTLLGGVINTRNFTTTDGAVAQGVSATVWNSSATVEILASGGPPVVDGAHQIVTSGAVASYSGTYAASLGSDVFIAYSTANAVSITSITYNSVAMTPVVTVPHNNTGAGFLTLYRAAGAGTGSAAAFSVTLSGSQHGVMDIFAYNGVGSLGTVTTGYGSSATPSTGPVTRNSGERILAILGGGALGTSTFSSPVGGTNRAFSTSSIAYAQIAVSDSIASPTTFSATFQIAHNWSYIAVPLVAAGVSAVPTNQFFQMF